MSVFFQWKYVSLIIMKFEIHCLVKNTQITNFMKTGTKGTDLFHSCGDTDRHDEYNNFFSEICERA
jgi:hypothetical protein